MPALRFLSTLNYKRLRLSVQVIRPRGHVIELDAVFPLWHHLKVGDGSGWYIEVPRPNGFKADVSVGSRVRASEDVFRVTRGRGEQ